MNTARFRNSTILGSITAAMALSVPSAARAQDAPPANADRPVVTAPDQTAADDSNSPDGGSIVVTGSRIPHPLNESSNVPVTSLSAGELTNSGKVNIGDTLNQLPSLRATFSQQNSTRFLGTAGLNLLDLRGLGPQRTLVLVNGRRHVAGDILSSGVAVDINTIPTDLIDHVDIVTGGDSAVYGSDAIAGVVNFVLKDHYSGVALHAQSGISQRGDAGAYFASLVAGRNFAGGRGNIAINAEYAQQNSLYASQRDWYNKQAGFVTVDTDPAGTANGSDGNPDRIFFNDIRSATNAYGGMVSFASPTGACGLDKDGKPFNCTFLFQGDGTLVPQTGARVGLSPNGSFIGGNGSTAREYKSVQLMPPNRRYSLNLVGHYEISPALVPFVEASYTHANILRGGTPPFIQGTTLASLGGDARERPRLDNPFLSAQARALITQQLIAAGANPAAITNATRLPFRRTLIDLGVREEHITRDTFRAVAGLRGEFNGNWHYEVSANYGQFKESNLLTGNMNIQRLLLAEDAARDPTSGQVVCRSKFDPAARIATVPGDPLSTGTLANDVAQCVPINLFGYGSISDAARNYVLQNTFAHGKITQFVGSAYLSGDTERFFRLPGGPVGFAIGAEYRRETNYYANDPLVNHGLTFYNAIPTFTSPAFQVKEAYGELRLPILKDLPFFHDLTVNAAGRVANYRGGTGTVYAYNVGGDWAPIRDIRFRANYSRSVRAPNVGESYGVQGQNFAPAPLDPCSARNLGSGSPTRQANCTAAGRPAAYDFVYTQSLSILSGGNPNLKAETSDSYTYGVVLQPRFVPGLTISADYFNIGVNNVITAPDAQSIMNSCYDAPTLQNQFCGLFRRAGAGGGPNAEIPFQIIEGSLQQTLLNYAQLKVRGLDVDVAYRRRLGFGEINTHFIWSHQFQNDQFIDPTQPGFADQLLGEITYPRDAFNWNVGLRSGIFDVFYQMRYLSPMAVDFVEDIESVQGRPPQNADFSQPARTPGIFYHNVRFGISPNERYGFYLGIDNVLDQKPPLGATGNLALTGSANTSASTGIYENKGRYFYAGVTAKF